MKRFKILLLIAIFTVPMMTMSIGCKGEVSEDGVSIEGN